MIKQNRSSYIKSREKSDPLIYAGFIALTAGLLFRILLMKLIGEEGVGYFAPVNEIFILCSLFITYGLAAATHSLVKYRIKREQYKSARRIFRCALTLALLFGVAACGIMLLANGFIAETVLLERYSWLPVCVMAPAVIFISLTGLLRGYFQGTGTRIPTVHSLILEQLLTIGFGVFVSAVLYRYGYKVAAVLHNNSLLSLYGAVGASLGMLIAALLSFLHLLLLYLLYRGTAKKQIYRDGSRTIEPKAYLYGSLFRSAVPYGIVAVLFAMTTLVDQRMYYYYRNIFAEAGETILDKITVWGNYYGIYLSVIGIITACVCLIPAKMIKVISGTWQREEYRSARDQMTRTVNSCVTVTVPVVFLTAVIAEPLAVVIGQGNTAITAELIQYGCALILFGTFTYLSCGLLKQFDKIYQLLMIAGGSFLLHLVVLYLLLSQAGPTGMGINGVALSNVAAAAGACVGGLALVFRHLQYGQEWLRRCLRILIITLICAGIAGLIAVLFKTALISVLPEFVVIIICSVTVLAVYLVLMLLLRGLTENELEKMPGGAAIITAAKFLHLL